jgi:hypothetical protein
MKYKDEIDKDKQIRLNEFPVLPGDKVAIKKDSDRWRCLVVKEVWSANPEYTLGGENAKDAGVISWNKKAREDCKAFLQLDHLPVKIRLKKSMWAIIGKKKYYTYELLRLIENGKLKKLDK